MNRDNPILYIVIPCYNGEKVLPYTNPMFIEKIESLINTGEEDVIKSAMTRVEEALVALENVSIR